MLQLKHICCIILFLASVCAIQVINMIVTADEKEVLSTIQNTMNWYRFLLANTRTLP